jgi:hypothetical protein
MQFEAYVNSHWLGGTTGLNPTTGMDVCLLWMLCVVQAQALIQQGPTTE